MCVFEFGRCFFHRRTARRTALLRRNIYNGQAGIIFNGSCGERFVASAKRRAEVESRFCFVRCFSISCFPRDDGNRTSRSVAESVSLSSSLKADPVNSCFRFSPPSIKLSHGFESERKWCLEFRPYACSLRTSVSSPQPTA